jgi:hypothetical protein
MIKRRKEPLIGISLRLPLKHVEAVEDIADKASVSLTDVYRAMIEVTSTDNTVLNKVKKSLAEKSA